MKFLLVCSAALAAGISFAGLVDFDNLKLNKEGEFATPNDNVTVAYAETSSYVEGKYTLDGELTDLGLTVTPNVTTQTIERFTLTFNVGFADTLPTTEAYENAAIGFAFKAANKAAYWDGDEWKEITLTTSVEEEATVTVLVEYDGRATQAKVRFTIGNYKYGWYEVGTIGDNVVKAFGAGIVTSIAGTTHTITTETVPVVIEGEGNVYIDFSPTQMSELATAIGVDESAVAAKLSEEATNKQTRMTNYLLFGDASSDCNAEVKAVGVPKADTANNVKIEVGGLNVRTVSGAQVEYVLMGSADNKTFTQIGEAKSTPSFEFPNTTSYRYFKVKAVIDYVQEN